MNDVIEKRITGQDSRWIYGEMWRNGMKTTDWVQIQHEYLKEIGRNNTAKRQSRTTD